ncbi:NAD(P)-dependent oxidoreductase [Martelella limonii]|uniref:NAD(P)-dependent oxidoreductase n=1 Tax=Martelella limonii TaxID=1647649 RepID=UPI0015804916|nr:NAD(P)-dependent oxidoreductase [Martelella limonii]
MKSEMIGIVGVGLMGHGIASNVQKSGYSIGFVDHPGNQPTETLRAGGAWVATTPSELAAKCATLILCLTGSFQVEQVIGGSEGILAGMQPGTVVIDCSTALPDSTRKFAVMIEDAGGKMLDAPMTRTPKEAAEGRLNLIVGGERLLYDEKKELLKSFAENITYAGPQGAGHTMKLLHNFVSLGFSAVLSEAAAASNRAGIDPAVLNDVLAHGGGAGVILNRLAPFILQQDASSFQFTLANAFKDIDYYCQVADALGTPSTIARSVRETYETPVRNGHASDFVPQLISILG